MGYYVDPEPPKTKEEWLRENGVQDDYLEVATSPEPLDVTWEKWKKLSCLPVVLVDNYRFVAAAIGYSLQEFKVFMDPNDTRPKELWWVPVEKLRKVCPTL